MNINEVPQDKKQFKDGEKSPKKMMYATNSDGSYTQIQSEGWEVENLALEQAWQDIDEQLAKEKQLVLNNEVSPISYYMIKERMDLGILSAYVGKWQWQVKRHLKPSVFNSLSTDLLNKYCSIFNISLEELRNVK